MIRFKNIGLFLSYFLFATSLVAQLPIQFSYTVSEADITPRLALKKTFTDYIDTSFVQSKKDVVWVRFRISPAVFKEQSLLLKCPAYNQISLYEVDGSRIVKIGMAGEISPLINPNIRRELYTIEIKSQAKSTGREFLAAFEAAHYSKKIIFPQVYTAIDFENFIFKRNSSFYESIWKPVYFGILLFFMGITLLYHLFSREKMFLFYFFYLLFISLRSALAGSLIVPEQLLPFLQDINFSGRHFQTITFLSFIFYYRFIEEISDAKNRPKIFKNFLKIQYAYLGLMILFDMAFVVEKYADTTLYSIFKFLEIVGLILGFICVGFLIKYWNSTLRYILYGVISFFTIALLGQEILIFFSQKSRLEQRIAFSIIWSVAYLVELCFFAVAIVKRAVDSQNENIFQLAENCRLRQLLEEQPTKLSSFSDKITIPTLHEKLVFKQTDIIRLAASGSYTVFHVLGQNPIMASYNLSEFASKLDPENFVRVHKSHLVNVQYIEKYAKKDNSFLTLTTGDSVPVSRTKKKLIEQYLSLCSSSNQSNRL